MRTPIIRFLSVSLATAVLMSTSSWPTSKTKAFDGHWWLLITSEEKSGYLSGDADCNRFELKLKHKYSRSFVEEQESVTNFYTANSDKRSLPVFEVARIVDDQPPLTPPAAGGEQWTEPHGYWDGEWWRGGVHEDRRGFIEGYLTCYERSPSLHGTFSKSSSEYVRLINHWYKFNEETGDVDPNRVDTKITDVLFKFRDQAMAAPSNPPQVMAELPGATLRWIHAAEQEFQRKHLDLNNYTISVIEESDSVTITLTSSDSVKGARGSTGSYPGFVVEINKKDLKVLRSNYIR